MIFKGAAAAGSPKKSVPFQVRLYFRGAEMKARRDESSPLVIKLLREAGWTVESDLKQPVFLSMEMTSFLSAQKVI